MITVKQSNSNKAGLGFVGALQITFIVLKLCNVIDWPWLYVLLPAIVCTVLWIFMIVVLLGVCVWHVKRN